MRLMAASCRPGLPAGGILDFKNRAGLLERMLCGSNPGRLPSRTGAVPKRQNAAGIADPAPCLTAASAVGGLACFLLWPARMAAVRHEAEEPAEWQNRVAGFLRPPRWPVSLSRSVIA